MVLQQLRQATWIRRALRVLVLCFALGTLAHAGHTHELSGAAETHLHCDYCTAFGGLIDTPVVATALLHASHGQLFSSAVHSDFIPGRAVSAAQPRAPPAC